MLDACKGVAWLQQWGGLIGILGCLFIFGKEPRTNRARIWKMAYHIRNPTPLPRPLRGLLAEKPCNPLVSHPRPTGGVRKRMQGLGVVLVRRPHELRARASGPRSSAFSFLIPPSSAHVHAKICAVADRLRACASRVDFRLADALAREEGKGAGRGGAG